LEKRIRIQVNGEWQELQIDCRESLLDLLRDHLGLTGTKRGCDTGDCGACSVILDGKIVNSCLVLAVEADGKSILTIEGLTSEGDLHPLQKSFVEHGAIQCGFCSPGMIMTAKALLDENANPSEEEIRMAIAGNICRCTGYVKIVEAITAVVREKR
jgi:aerobic carbon-monoxide dehydrogenase small subunit